MNKLLPVSLVCSLLAPLSAQAMKGFKFEIETLGGQKLDQSDFKNNVLIVDFWGTWCAPCKRAIPGLVDLYKKYKHHGLEIVGLNYKERGSAEQMLATVRGFAKTHGITYTLALGTAKVRKQVLGFSGYPTMLFFKKGMVFDHLEVGFSPEHLETMEKWIRSELGLSDDAESPDGGKKPSDKGDEDEEKSPAKAKKTKVPAGVIYRPGNHDTGFEFEVKGLDGKKVKFASYRGKKVVLVLTSTWDQEAKNTAALLNKLQGSYGKKGVAVLAASIEIKKGRTDRFAAIETFAKKHQTTYQILPVGLDFLKKIHEPSGVPMYLVFDKKGKLVLRKGNKSTKERILKAIEQALAS